MIYLCRHGKIQLADDRRRYVGQMDLPLSEEGLEQARCLQRRLAGAEISAVYCSDLSRSRQTAAIIAAGRNAAVLPREDLREISLGEWEGQTFDSIGRRYPGEFEARGEDIGCYRVPGGESFADCSWRVTAALHEILQSSAGHIAIAGHAGVNRLILCHILGMPLANLFRVDQDYGCLNIIRSSGSGYQVQLVNDHTDSGEKRRGGMPHVR